MTMGNPRNWTTNFNATQDALKRFVKRKGCTSMTKRKAAMERAATMPNRLPPAPSSEGA
jgi:hypothetical protein